MDNLMVSHAQSWLLEPNTASWEAGPRLAWAAAGALGAVLAGRPTVFGGFGLGYRRGVASYSGAEWKAWQQQLGSSRVSGLALTIPSDFKQFCS